MRLHGPSAALLTAILLGALGAPARAAADPDCRLSDGPIEYTRTLGPLVGGFTPAPPAPGQPAPSPPSWLPSSGVGAGNLAREVLGGQYALHWMSNALQGWVVGLAPGPLDPAAARAAILDRIAAHYTAAETAHLDERLHISRQPYSQAELNATGEALVAALRAEPGLYWGVGISCRLSDAFRAEVTLYSPATPEQFLRVMALAEPYRDKVRVQLAPHGPPMPAVLPLPPPQPPRPQPRPRPQRAAFARHVKMALLRRCVRGRAVRVAARAGSPPVRSLTVHVAGRAPRTIIGRRLSKPLVVTLRGRRTEVTVTARLTDRRVAVRTVTYTRCR